MKGSIQKTGALVAIALAGAAAVRAVPAEVNLPDQIVTFIASKDRQAHELARKSDFEIDADSRDFFATARAGRLVEAKEARDKLSQRSPHAPGFDQGLDQIMRDVILALGAFTNDPTTTMAFGNDMMRSVPDGAVLFGGTDPGRGLPTALCRAPGDPFFNLTQNALGSPSYLAYVRFLYGDKLQMPNEKEIKEIYGAVIADAEKRQAHDRDFPNEPKQLKPGENYQTVGGQGRLSSEVATMRYNGEIAIWIVEKNTKREFYVEESYPIEWMNPLLEPHKLVMKLHRTKVALTPEIIERDKQFWMDELKGKIGDWLKPETSLAELAAFETNIYIDKNYANFDGDRKLAEGVYARLGYAHCREAVGRVYAWRADHADNAEERDRLRAAADFAFRQSLALAPGMPETVYNFVALLNAEKRYDDTVTVLEAAVKFDSPWQRQLSDYLQQMREYRKQATKPR